MPTSIQKVAESKAVTKNEGKTMQAYIKQMEGEIRKALPSVLTPERFTRITLPRCQPTGSCRKPRRPRSWAP